MLRGNVSNYNGTGYPTGPGEICTSRTEKPHEADPCVRQVGEAGKNMFWRKAGDLSIQHCHLVEKAQQAPSMNAKS